MGACAVLLLATLLVLAYAFFWYVAGKAWKD